MHDYVYFEDINKRRIKLHNKGKRTIEVIFINKCRKIMTASCFISARVLSIMNSMFSWKKQPTRGTITILILILILYMFI